MLQAGMGLHGYEPNVTTLFGLPIAIRAGGVIFDLPIVRAVLVDGLDQAKNAQFSQQIGLLGSALEHAVPEQMFTTDEQPGEAISAVKALSKANAQGQRIYQLTQDNMAATLPNLNLAFETEAEIRSALNAGMTVIAHTDNVSVPGWTGAGYIIFDPVTGSGAYKIAGGANGGWLDVGSELSPFLTVLALGLGLTSGITALIGLLIAVSLALFTLTLLINELGLDSPCLEPAVTLFRSTVIPVVLAALLFGVPGAGAIAVALASFIIENAILTSFPNAPMCQP